MIRVLRDASLDVASTYIVIYPSKHLQTNFVLACRIRYRNADTKRISRERDGNGMERWNATEDTLTKCKTKSKIEERATCSM